MPRTTADSEPALFDLPADSEVLQSQGRQGGKSATQRVVAAFVDSHRQHHGVDPTRAEIGRVARDDEVVAADALALCLASRGPGDAPLGELGEIEVSLVSDEDIARVHGEFMDDPTPTDVITFQHGEILVSLDTARREAVGGPALTPAELRVLPYLATHLSLKEIAAELIISRNTAKSHAVSIYRKLGATSRSEAVARATERGLLHP